jgi:hypothetical protein
MGDAAEIVQQGAQGVAGGGLMKTGSSVTLGGTVGVFLLENAQIISIAAVLLGAGLGVLGFVLNRRDVAARRRREEARELREQELHARRMNIKIGDGPEL